jgi:hypothetical protein
VSVLSAPRLMWSKAGLKQHSKESVCHESHDKNKGDDDRRDKPILHCIPSIIPARRDKSSRIPYEIGLDSSPASAAHRDLPTPGTSQGRGSSAVAVLSMTP